jgi:hypothetical protein
MELKVGTFCPLIKKDCIQNKCAWFIKVMGYDTNTGKDVEDWSCAIAWIPALLIDGTGQQRQTGAAVESFRNEMVKANKTNTDVVKASQEMLIRRLAGGPVGLIGGGD